MPDSQENDWEDLGFLSEEDLIASRDAWDEAIASFEAVVRSFRNVQPAVERASENLRMIADAVAEAEEAQARSIRETQSMAVDIRHGEYPRRDSYGTYWYDPSGFHSDEPHVCFICNRPTGRIDIDFHGAFCNSVECNEVIRQDLERLNGGPEQRD